MLMFVVCITYFNQHLRSTLTSTLNSLPQQVLQQVVQVRQVSLNYAPKQEEASVGCPCLSSWHPS